MEGNKNKSTADKLMEAAKLREEQFAKFKEEVEQLKSCANRIFSSEDGKFFAKKICQLSGIFDVEKSLDPQRLAFSAGCKTMYLLLFRKILDKDVLSEIERGE